MTLTESFWRSWDNSLSESLLYCIFYSATRGTSYLGGLGLKAECRDSRIISMINFDLNLIMNAFFGNKAKDIVIIHPREIKSLVSSCQQLSILSHVIFVTLEQEDEQAPF